MANELVEHQASYKPAFSVAGTIKPAKFDLSGNVSHPRVRCPEG